MKRFATDLLHFTAHLIPRSLLQRWVRREVIGVFYHAVSEEPLAHVQHLYPPVPLAAFQGALAFLQEHYTFVSYQQIQDHYEGKASLPPRAVHLSFDDGFAECYHVVRPILLQNEIPCTFFVTLDWLDNRMLYFRHQVSLFVTKMDALENEEQEQLVRQINQRLGLSLDSAAGFKTWIMAFREAEEAVLATVAEVLGVDTNAYLARNPPYLTTDQVQEMQQEGFTIGSHGLTHRKLGFIAMEETEGEIVESCRQIRAITGESVVPFAFPQSAANLDRSLLAEIYTRHPFVGLLFDTKDLHQDAPFIVNRIWAERPLTPERRLHPLPEIIDHAYRQAWAEGVRRRKRRNSLQTSGESIKAKNTR